MLRKFLSMMALALGVLAIAPAAASASTGYQLDNVSDTNVTPGQSVTVNFNGFMAGSDVKLTFESVPVDLGTFEANDQGVVRTAVTIPSNASFGSHSIVATGVDPDGNPYVVRLAITVSATGEALTPGEGLPATGSSIVLILAIGGLALASGFGLFGAARQRQDA